MATTGEKPDSCELLFAGSKPIVAIDKKIDADKSRHEIKWQTGPAESQRKYKKLIPAPTELSWSVKLELAWPTNKYEDVGITGNIGLLEPFQLYPGRYSRQEYYRVLSEVLNINDFIYKQDFRAKHVTHRTYEDYNFIEVEHALAPLGPDFRRLLLDPGIIAHGQDFVKFVRSAKARKIEWKDPWSLRLAFSESLGKKTVFRALFLTPKEADVLSKNGMAAGYLRQEGFKGFPAAHAIPYAHQLKYHNHQRTADSIFQSVTSYPDLAIAVTQALFASKVETAGNHRIFLFEIDISKLDLISFTPGGFTAEKADVRNYKNPKNKIVVETKGKGRNTYLVDEELESFIAYSILPSEIISVTEIEHGEMYRLL